MKAAILREVQKPLCIEDVPEPKVGPDEVLIETHTCGICRTDLHIQDGLAYIPSLPHIPGHEPAGVVVAVGERVERVTVGQRVVPHLFVTCGQCRYCRTGRDAQCAAVKGVIGVTIPGGFAEFFKAPEQNLLVLPDNVPFEAGGLVSCAVITAVHAYRRARLTVHDVVVVLGMGCIGRILLQLLRFGGMRPVVISRSPETLESVCREGAVLGLLSTAPDQVEQIKSLSDGMGAQCVFDCVGTASTMKTAAALVQRGGQIVVIGEEPEFPEITTIEIAQRELEIVGSRNGSWQDGIDALALLAAGVIRPPIGGRFPLEQLNDALQLMRDNRAQGRLIIKLTF